MKKNLLLNLLSDGAVNLVAGGKVGVFHQPGGYFVRVLGVMLGDVLLVDVAHADDDIRPGKQAFRYTLRAVGATVVPEFLKSE